ncbi:hypothetical protein ABVT39_012846 [Epinephelus coioides]
MPAVVEVVIGGRKRDSTGVPRLNLSNRYAALSADNNPVHPTDVPPAAAAPPRQDLDPKAPTAYTTDLPPLLADSARVTGSSTMELQRPAFRSAVVFLVQSQRRRSRRRRGIPLPATHCFPGDTVPVILEKLPGLLRSLPSSITRVVIHVGCNDASRQQSELTKKDFNALFRLLNDTGKSVFISGPLPIHTLGAGHFSRLLYLNTWLQSTCRAFNFGFIDNFNLFWNRPSSYKADGVHPNRLGSQMLTANIRHTVQYAPCD